MSTKDLINLGVYPDSGTGDSARRGGEKINNLFADIYANFGDNPVGNDNTANWYGVRRQFQEYEFKVGELHSVGKFITAIFKSQATHKTPGTDGWNLSVDSTGSGIPDIYEDSEWYFLSRGENLNLDLSRVDTAGHVHLVLPLAVAGDRIIIRDMFGTWGTKKISVWTTPYDFQSIAQVQNWATYTEGLAELYASRRAYYIGTGADLDGLMYPDSDSVTITDQYGKSYYTPLRDGTTDATIHAAYNGSNDEGELVVWEAANVKVIPTSIRNKLVNRSIKQKFQRVEIRSVDGQSNLSPFVILDSEVEVEFTYQGPHKGWRAITKKDFWDPLSVLGKNVDSDTNYYNEGRTNRTTSNVGDVTSVEIDKFPYYDDTLPVGQRRGYRTSKFISQVTDGTDIQSSEILVTTINGAAYITEYGIVSSIDRALYPTKDIVTYTAVIESANWPQPDGTTLALPSVVIYAIAAQPGAVIEAKLHRTAVIE